VYPTPWNQAFVEDADAFCSNVAWAWIPHHNFEDYVSSNRVNTQNSIQTPGCRFQNQLYDLAWQYCHPQIIVPDEVYQIRPEWATCIRAENGIAFDPPFRVHRQSKFSWGNIGKRTAVAAATEMVLTLDNVATKTSSLQPAMTPSLVTSTATSSMC